MQQTVRIGQLHDSCGMWNEDVVITIWRSKQDYLPWCHYSLQINLPLCPNHPEADYNRIFTVQTTVQFAWMSCILKTYAQYSQVLAGLVSFNELHAGFKVVCYLLAY